MLEDKYKIETLPVTEEFLCEKRLLQDRGELVLLSDGEEIRHITVFYPQTGPRIFQGRPLPPKKV